MESWSKELMERTRDEAYSGAMMKSLDHKYGMMTKRDANGIKIVGLQKGSFFPMPTDEVIADFADIDELLAAGWAID